MSCQCVTACDSLPFEWVGSLTLVVVLEGPPVEELEDVLERLDEFVDPIALRKECDQPVDRVILPSDKLRHSLTPTHLASLRLVPERGEFGPVTGADGLSTYGLNMDGVLDDWDWS